MSITNSYVFQDWNSNQYNVKGRFVMIAFRCASFVSKYILLKIIFCWYLLIYKVVIGWLLSVEIDPKAAIGKYGFGSVITGTARIGDNCTIRHLTTISSKKKEDGSLGPSPIIGNNVDIGVNASIIGGVHIGNDVIIGAGAVVTKNIKSYCVVGGNPTVVLKMIYKFPLDKDLIEGNTLDIF